MSNLRWGVINTADSEMTKVIAAIRRAERSELVAIASRNRDRAAAAAWSARCQPEGSRSDPGNMMTW